MKPAKELPNLIERDNFNPAKVYHRRVELGFTMVQLAAKMHKSLSTVHALEHGLFQPTPPTLRVLSQALQVEPIYFFEQ